MVVPEPLRAESISTRNKTGSWLCAKCSDGAAKQHAAHPNFPCKVKQHERDVRLLEAPLNFALDYLKSGKIISLISDAGTPSISDPGSILVNECINNEIKIFPIPGPSAISTAVSISGFSDKFLFYGFFPEKKKS